MARKVTDYNKQASKQADAELVMEEEPQEIQAGKDFLPIIQPRARRGRKRDVVERAGDGMDEAGKQASKHIYRTALYLFRPGIAPSVRLMP